MQPTRDSFLCEISLSVFSNLRFYFSVTKKGKEYKLPRRLSQLATQIPLSRPSTMIRSYCFLFFTRRPPVYFPLFSFPICTEILNSSLPAYNKGHLHMFCFTYFISFYFCVDYSILCTVTLLIDGIVGDFVNFF
jgi:hypothetical protein